MKTLLTAAALAIAFAAPAAEARVAHHKTSHATSGIQAKASTKKATKGSKHGKPAKKGHRKAA